MGNKCQSVEGPNDGEARRRTARRESIGEQAKAALVDAPNAALLDSCHYIGRHLPDCKNDFKMDEKVGRFRQAVAGPDKAQITKRGVLHEVDDGHHERIKEVTEGIHAYPAISPNAKSDKHRVSFKTADSDSDEEEVETEAPRAIMEFLDRKRRPEAIKDVQEEEEQEIEQEEEEEEDEIRNGSKEMDAEEISQLVQEHQKAQEKAENLQAVYAEKIKPPVYEPPPIPTAKELCVLNYMERFEYKDDAVSEPPPDLDTWWANSVEPPCRDNQVENFLSKSKMPFKKSDSDKGWPDIEKLDERSLSALVEDVHERSSDVLSKVQKDVTFEKANFWLRGEDADRQIHIKQIREAHCSENAAAVNQAIQKKMEGQIFKEFEELEKNDEVKKPAKGIGMHFEMSGGEIQKVYDKDEIEKMVLAKRDAEKIIWTMDSKLGVILEHENFLEYLRNQPEVTPEANYEAIEEEDDQPEQLSAFSLASFAKTLGFQESEDFWTEEREEKRLNNALSLVQKDVAKEKIRKNSQESAEEVFKKKLVDLRKVRIEATQKKALANMEQKARAKARGK